MRISDALGSLAFMATAADAPLGIVLGLWLLCIAALVAFHACRRMKKWGK